MSNLGPVFICGGLIGIFLFILSPSASRRIQGVLPRADRPPDRFISSQTPRRGMLLATLAAASAADILPARKVGQVGLVLVCIVASVLYRYDPTRRVVGIVLAVLGLFATAYSVVDASCDGADTNIAFVAALALGGTFVFILFRLVFGVVGLSRGDGPASLIMLFGIVGLAVFVARPFGVDVLRLNGFKVGIALTVGLYLFVAAVSGILPGFAASILGVCMLAANISVAALPGECFAEARSITFAIIGGAVAWFAIGLWRSDSPRKRAET